jgi:hypothetical protein
MGNFIKSSDGLKMTYLRSLLCCIRTQIRKGRLKVLDVTHHGTKRIRERCGIKAKGVDRLAKIAFEKGLTHSETKGELKRYITSLYFYNKTANNIRIYGDKVYIFCDEVLVTVLDLPRTYRNIVNKLMRRRDNIEYSEQG